MRFAVRFLRHQGRTLSWREVVNQAPRVGDLRVEECVDAEAHRYVRTATLFDAESSISSSARPILLEARLLAMTPQAFILAGIERVAGVDYAQSWLVSDASSSITAK